MKAIKLFLHKAGFHFWEYQHKTTTMSGYTLATYKCKICGQIMKELI